MSQISDELIERMEQAYLDASCSDPKTGVCIDILMEPTESGLRCMRHALQAALASGEVVLRKDVEVLVDALEELVDEYIRVVEYGGNWNPREDRQVIEAEQALARFQKGGE